MTSRNRNQHRARRPVMLGMAAALGCMGSLAAQAQAQVVGMPEAESPARSAAPIRIGNIDVRPSVQAGYGYDDNVTNAERGKKSSSTFSLSPSIRFETEYGASRYALSYAGQAQRYVDSRRDDIDSNTLSLDGDHTLTGRTDLGWTLNYGTGADARNSNDAARDTSTPNEWETTGFAGTFGYGANSAQGRLELDLGRSDKRYTNNRDVTRRLDNSADKLGARFFWRVGPKTRLLAEVQQADIEYDLRTSGRDSTERRYYVGGTWEATAKTTGIVKLGRQTKEFDRSADGRGDFSGFSWEAQVRWAPRTYSVFNLVTSRATQDSTAISGGLPDYTLDQTYAIRWTHQWSGTVATRVAWALTDSDYEIADRQEDVARLSIGVDYRFSRWLGLSFDYSHQRRDSTQAGTDYNKNLYMLSANFAL